MLLLRGAVGVGTQKILGKVHMAQLEIGGSFLPTSLSILEDQGTSSVMQCGAVQCGAVLCSAVSRSAVQCSAVHCSAVSCSVVLSRLLSPPEYPLETAHSYVQYVDMFPKLQWLNNDTHGLNCVVRDGMLARP